MWPFFKSDSWLTGEAASALHSQLYAAANGTCPLLRVVLTCLRCLPSR
jgi:hypothetical protein